MDQNILKFVEQFEGWVLKDIRILLRLEDESGNILSPDRNTYTDRHRPFVAAVILTCCAIDMLSAFRYGRYNSDVGDTFKCFIRNYFTKENTKSKKTYNVEHVYNGLRNDLLHGYSLGKDLALGHENAKQHLEKSAKRTIIDVFEFYYDLESVYKVYKSEIESGKYKEEFDRRWQYAPVIKYVATENIKRPE